MGKLVDLTDKLIYGLRTTLHENNDLNQNSGSVVGRATLSSFQRGVMEVLATSHARAGISSPAHNSGVGGP